MNQLISQDENVFSPELEKEGVLLSVRRFDQLHPEAGGNKLFKLRYWIDPLKEGSTILSFGGAYSNHLLALAAIGRERGFHSIGIVRGERPAEGNNWLKRMEELGMRLEFISREHYKQKEIHWFLEELNTRFHPDVIVPEGGAGLKGVKGAKEMVQATEPFDWVVLPGATGTTVAGIAQQLSSSTCKILCVQVLKGKNLIQNELLRTTGIALEQFGNVLIRDDFHDGGYAKYSSELRKFHNHFCEQTGILLDRVYGIKAMNALFTLAKQGFFKKGARVLYLHTGGNGPLPIESNQTPFGYIANTPQ
jgi:1-aminocyclopropane-1-carboxylate deaminase